MTTWFRIWEKKNKGRRTGSNAYGIVGEACLFLALFLFGACGLIVVVLSLATRSWPADTYFPTVFYQATSATIEGRRLGEQPSEEAILYRPEFLIEYSVDGKTFRTWTYDHEGEYLPDSAAAREILDNSFPESQECTCWYDPITHGPDREANDDFATGETRDVVLVRGIRWSLWLMVTMFTTFILTGGAGVFYLVLNTGASLERRASLVKRASELGRMGKTPFTEEEYPMVPSNMLISDSPGTVLAFRLPVARVHGWRLFATAAFCLAWNAMATGFVLTAIWKHLSGDHNWLPTVLALVFLAIGVWVVYHFIMEMIATTWIGPTNIEISQLPLRPGMKCDICIFQAGQMAFRTFRVFLICEEKTSFRHGTDIRHDSREVLKEQVFYWEDFDILPGEPFQQQCSLIIPEHAMHSFQSEHNVLQWRLVVEAEPTGWLSFRREFPVIVYPRAVRKEAT